MSKSMKMVKTYLTKNGINPTNRNARKHLRRLRKLKRKLRAEQKRVDSLVPRYKTCLITVGRIRSWLN